MDATLSYDKVVDLLVSYVSNPDDFRSLCTRLRVMGVHSDVVYPLSVDANLPFTRWVSTFELLKGRTDAEQRAFIEGLARIYPALQKLSDAILQEMATAEREGLSTVSSLIRALAAVQKKLLGQSREAPRASDSTDTGFGTPTSPAIGGAVSVGVKARAGTPEWDIFICHASEDKDTFVRELVKALQRKKLSVWYDEFTLKLNDRLLQKINNGLAHSSYGVVVLSPAFFSKKWPQDELAGLFELEINGRIVVLPVWHNVGVDEVRRFSPILAGRVGVETSKGLDHVVAEIERAIGVS